MDQELKKLAGYAELDQMSESFRSFAKVMGAYFSELKAAKMPYELTCDLVRDCHMAYWAAMWEATLNKPKVG